jgi:predicted CxxxxCH...CXXCH cytochrome family protein
MISCRQSGCHSTGTAAGRGSIATAPPDSGR